MSCIQHTSLGTSSATPDTIQIQFQFQKCNTNSFSDLLGLWLVEGKALAQFRFMNMSYILASVSCNQPSSPGTSLAALDTIPIKLQPGKYNTNSVSARRTGRGHAHVIIYNIHPL